MSVPKSKQELFGLVINDASAKSPPVDADCVALMDTGASNFLKKLTLTGLKAFLKTYFDTLYSGAGGVPDGDKGDITVSSSGTVWTVDILASGTYAPTRSAEANMDGNVTMSEAQYMRVGNTVTVSGRFTADPTLAATATSFEMTLPVASNIGAVEDVAGTAFCGSIAGMGGEIIGVVANDTAKIFWVSSDLNSNVWSYVFEYQVI